MQLAAFSRFKDMTDAIAATTAMIEGKLGHDMKKFLKKHIVKKELTDELAVRVSALLRDVCVRE